MTLGISPGGSTYLRNYWRLRPGIKGVEALYVLGQSRTHPRPGKVPGVRLLFPPSEPPGNAEATGEVGEDCLSPRVCYARASSAAACRFESRRAPRRGDSVGRPSLAYLSWPRKKGR